MHEGKGGQSNRAVPRRNADCFHVWGGQESRAGCRQVRLALMRKVVLVMEEAQDTEAQWQSAAKAETTM